MYNENELAQTIPSQNPIVDAMASTGRKGDTMMAHVTPGDYVIPKDILVQHPEFLVKLKKVMQDAGEDYRTHMVGSGFENINPDTSSPEFGFLGSIGRIAGQAIRGLPGGKSRIGGALYGAGLGAVTGGLGTVLAGAGTGYLGGSYNKAVAKQQSGSGAEAVQPVAPMNLPSSMQELGGLTDQQRRTYLATQGAQGGGLGGSSKDYYINLLQRNIQSGQGGLAPVESQYLGSLGVNTGLSGQDLVNALRGA